MNDLTEYKNQHTRVTTYQDKDSGTIWIEIYEKEKHTSIMCMSQHSSDLSVHLTDKPENKITKNTYTIKCDKNTMSNHDFTVTELKMGQWGRDELCKVYYNEE